MPNATLKSHDKYLDASYQRAVDDWIGRELIANASTLVYELTQKFEHFPDYEDELLNAFHGLPDFEEAALQEGWEKNKDGIFYRRATGFEHHLSVNLNERGQIAVSVHKVTEPGQGSNGETIWQFNGLADDAPEDVDLTDPEQVEQYLYEQGVFILEDHLSTDDSLFEINDTAETWQELCEQENIDTDDYRSEVFEHWIVSPFLADDLEERGELILRDFFGFTIWGRSTTGQAISMDPVICDIYDDLQERVKSY